MPITPLKTIPQAVSPVAAHQASFRHRPNKRFSGSPAVAYGISSTAAATTNICTTSMTMIMPTPMPYVISLPMICATAASGVRNISPKVGAGQNSRPSGKPARPNQPTHEYCPRQNAVIMNQPMP